MSWVYLKTSFYSTLCTIVIWIVTYTIMWKHCMLIDSFVFEVFSNRKLKVWLIFEIFQVVQVCRKFVDCSLRILPVSRCSLQPIQFLALSENSCRISMKKAKLNKIEVRMSIFRTFQKTENCNRLTLEKPKNPAFETSCFQSFHLFVVVSET